MPDKYVMEEQAMLDRWRRKLARAEDWFNTVMEEQMADGMFITKVQVSPPRETGQDWRVVLHGRTESGDRKVAFCNGQSFGEALMNVQQTSDKNGLKWRDDIPWADRQTGAPRGAAKGSKGS